MPIINRLADFQADLTAWRRQLHEYPEIGFEEHRTSAMVAEKLADFGIEVHRGLAGTGVVGVLKGDRPGHRSIGLRADMDALSLLEKNEFAHVSKIPGKMHACGHDGHTTMLLGAARYLAETRNFAGTVYFVFQPAEEGLAGAKRMIDEGLFERFPMDQVYGFHNWPGLPAGDFAIHDGVVMAAGDRFDITITGKGAHAAQPHRGVDTVLVAAHVVTALQSVVARNVDPYHNAVLTVAQIHGGDAYNIIPDDVTLRGTVRTFRADAQDLIESAMRRVVEGVCATFGATFAFEYVRGYPPTMNHPDGVALARKVATEVVGAPAVHADLAPNMAAEDFSYMLQERPGSYIWIGNGSDEGGRQLHNPRYEFNDEILPVGASYLSRLVETSLA